MPVRSGEHKNGRTVRGVDRCSAVESTLVETSQPKKARYSGVKLGQSGVFQKLAAIHCHRLKLVLYLGGHFSGEFGMPKTMSNITPIREYQDLWPS